MNIHGLDNFIRTLNNASNNFDKEASKTLNIVSQKLVAKVKLKTPVDTGVLRRSWRVKSEGNFAKIIYNNIHYASHIEYGHRTRGGKSFVDGRYMLTKSVKEIEKDLDKEFSIMIENLWNK